MSAREFTLLPVFCGSGGAALGAQACDLSLLGQRWRYRVLPGVDLNETACANFEYLTGVASLCADVRGLTPADLRSTGGGLLALWRWWGLG